MVTDRNRYELSQGIDRKMDRFREMMLDINTSTQSGGAAPEKKRVAPGVARRMVKRKVRRAFFNCLFAGKLGDLAVEIKGSPQLQEQLRMEEVRRRIARAERLLQEEKKTSIIYKYHSS